MAVYGPWLSQIHLSALWSQQHTILHFWCSWLTTFWDILGPILLFIQFFMLFSFWEHTFSNAIWNHHIEIYLQHSFNIRKRESWRKSQATSVIERIPKIYKCVTAKCDLQLCDEISSVTKKNVVLANGNHVLCKLKAVFSPQVLNMDFCMMKM